jgi:hypothetical protein
MRGSGPDGPFDPPRGGTSKKVAVTSGSAASAERMWACIVACPPMFSFTKWTLIPTTIQRLDRAFQAFAPLVAIRLKRRRGGRKDTVRSP